MRKKSCKYVVDFYFQVKSCSIYIHTWWHSVKCDYGSSAIREFWTHLRISRCIENAKAQTSNGNIGLCVYETLCQSTTNSIFPLKYKYPLLDVIDLGSHLKEFIRWIFKLMLKLPSEKQTNPWTDRSKNKYNVICHTIRKHKTNMYFRPYIMLTP